MDIFDIINSYNIYIYISKQLLTYIKYINGYGISKLISKFKLNPFY